MIGDQVVWNCGIENTCEMCNTRLFLSFSLSLSHLLVNYVWQKQLLACL